MANIGEQIKEARRAKGWTQDDLAKAMNMSRQAVSHWETGRTLPDAQMLIRLAQTLEHSFETGGAVQPAGGSSQNEPVGEDELTCVSTEDESLADQLNNTEDDQTEQNSINKLRTLVITLAVIIVALIITLYATKNKPVTRVRDSEGIYHQINDYQAMTPREEGKAYIIIDTMTETTQGDNMVYWMYTFVLREENGIDFHIDRLENVWIKQDNAQVFSYLEKDLAAAEVGPDIPAFQKVEFTGGMPLEQPNMTGVGCRVTDHDAGGAELNFMAYIPFPRE